MLLPWLVTIMSGRLIDGNERPRGFPCGRRKTRPGSKGDFGVGLRGHCTTEALYRGEMETYHYSPGSKFADSGKLSVSKEVGF